MSSVTEGAFPVVYVRSVPHALAFYGEVLGFEELYRQPPEGEPGYVGLKLGDARIGLVNAEWPAGQLGVQIGGGARFELFVYVRDVDKIVERVRAEGGPVLREPEDMPWGERVGYVADPDGNPVAVATRSG